MKHTCNVLFLSFLLISLGSFSKADIPVFTGKWDMSCETHSMTLFLVQNDKQIVGTYDVPHASGCIGYIIGTMKGNRFDFEFHEVDYGGSVATFNGTGELIISQDGNAIEGKISGVFDSGEKYEAKWTGTRLD